MQNNYSLFEKCISKRIRFLKKNISVMKYFIVLVFFCEYLTSSCSFSRVCRPSRPFRHTSNSPLSSASALKSCPPFSASSYFLITSSHLNPGLPSGILSSGFSSMTILMSLFRLRKACNMGQKRQDLSATYLVHKSYFKGHHCSTRAIS